MIDQLAIFAAEVKKVAREVGTEGKLGVQAEVGNVQGIWQEITCVWALVVVILPSCFLTSCRLSVNTMASNLTTQVRGFAQISAAAMDGDFTRFITVEASGEMDSLKTQINQMVFNLRDSIQKNTAAREAAELANRSKSEFLANMSHEIRCVTPITFFGTLNFHALCLNCHSGHRWMELLGWQSWPSIATWTDRNARACSLYTAWRDRSC